MFCRTGARTCSPYSLYTITYSDRVACFECLLVRFEPELRVETWQVNRQVVVLGNTRYNFWTKGGEPVEPGLELWSKWTLIGAVEKNI